MQNNNFKSLSEYKNEIHSCSKCGLCQAVCPLFRTTGNECTVSRGQFIMLDGVIKDKLKLSGKINKYLNMCLKCGKCSEFCPSEIDVVDILLAAKHEYFKNSFEGKIYGLLESKYVFDNFLKLIKFILGMFCFRKKSKLFDVKSVYFGGCISALKPGISNYVTKILNKAHIEVLKSDFNCCGMPFLTTGNFERFIEVMNENISKIPDGCQYVVTDCASCEWAWEQYKKYVTDENLKLKLSKIKVKNLYDLIAEENLRFVSKKDHTLTYHKPCHTKDSSYENILKIIKNIENTKYVELEGIDECCGFGGYEHLDSIKGTSQVREWKSKHIKHTKADFVVTNCVGCLVALSLMKSSSNVSPRRLISFLKDFCQIK